MASPINSILGLNRTVKEYQGLNECGSRIDELKGRKLGAAFPSAALGKIDSLPQAPSSRRTVTVTLNDAADCSSFSLTLGGGYLDDCCECESDSDDDGILRSFEDEVILSSNDLATVSRLRFVLLHEDRRVATYHCLLFGKRVCLMVPSDEDCSGSALASLFDYVSEKLECEAVILCLPRDNLKISTLIRSFMFLGFETLPPQDEYCQGLDNANFFFMAYCM
eukprot:scpid82181/ scgid12914/ 